MCGSSDEENNKEFDFLTSSSTCFQTLSGCSEAVNTEINSVSAVRPTWLIVYILFYLPKKDNNYKNSDTLVANLVKLFVCSLSKDIQTETVRL